MVWEPFVLALMMGLLVSGAIYFIVMWPQVEPPDEPVAEPGAQPGAQPAAELSSDE